ncbi:hypothetical protein ABPG74_003415 [Tetrahymena malaccensis]
MSYNDNSNTLVTNHYKIKINNIKINCYEFQTQPPIDPLLLNRKSRYISRVFNKKIKEIFSTFIIGSQLIYSPINLQNKVSLGTFDFVSPKTEGCESVTQELEVFLVKKKDIVGQQLEEENKELQNILGQLMRNFQNNTKGFQQLGATKRFAMNVIKNISNGLEAVLGVETFFKFSPQTGFQLSVDYCIKVINNTSVYDFLKKSMSQGADSIQEKMQNCVVISNYGDKKMYKVNGVAFDLNPNSVFEMRDPNESTGKKKISFVQYYELVHNIRIRDNRQPLLIVEKKRKQNKRANQEGKPQQETPKIYLIPELCQMTGIPDELQSDFMLKKAITQVSQPKPQERSQHCGNYVSALIHQNQKALSEWGITLSQNDPVKARYQVIQPGCILMNQNREINIYGEKQLDRKIQDRMYQPCYLKKWCAICHKSDQQLAGQFMSTLKNRMQAHGIGFNEPNYFTVEGQSQDELKRLIDSFPPDVDFIVFILQGAKGKGKNYQYLKQFLLKEKPIPSQMILQGTIKSSKDGCQVICNKICNQICIKVGGIPYIIKDLPFSNLPTMLVGIDYIRKENQKSVYSFVASVDSTFCKFFSGAQLLDASDQNNKFVDKLLQASLLQFRQKNGILPQRLIIYRQAANNILNEPLKEEIAIMKKCITEMEMPQCKIHMVGVNSSDKTKFFNEDYSNPAQGTVISQDVVSQQGDFFLVSQRSMQGTAQPMMYKEIYSDYQGIELEQIRSQLHTLTYRMSYLFYNFTGAIKIPSILKYAEQQTKFMKNNFENLNKMDPQTILSQRMCDKNSTFYI